MSILDWNLIFGSRLGNSSSDIEQNFMDFSDLWDVFGNVTNDAGDY